MRRKKEPPELTSLASAMSFFSRQHDRGSALIGAAWVDDMLEHCLRSVLRDDNKVLDSMLKSEGPLGSFAARAKILYLLGYIGADAYADLTIVRDVRNLFAHVRENVRFRDQTVQDRCRRLVAVQAFRLGSGDPLRSPRLMYLGAVYLLCIALKSVARTAERPGRMADGAYGAWGRSMLKSMKLKSLAADLGFQDTGA